MIGRMRVTLLLLRLIPMSPDRSKNVYHEMCEDSLIYALSGVVIGKPK